MQIMSDAMDVSLMTMIDCGRLYLYPTFIRLVAILPNCSNYSAITNIYSAYQFIKP